MKESSTTGSIGNLIWGGVVVVAVTALFAIFGYEIALAIIGFFLFWGGIVAVAVAAFLLRDKAKEWWAGRKFLREAPDQIQSCMATVSENLAAGAGHLATAERELEASTAPLFWDAMDDFGTSILRCRTVWNGAVDIAERYEQLSAGPRSDEDGAIVPDAALPATIVELGEKWMNLRRGALGNEHFASIFEQRRQADKIADRLKKQGEEIQTAIDAARRAELAASQASAVAGQALAEARTASAMAQQASAEARSAKSVAWSKI